jgi:hypothetical protein
VSRVIPWTWICSGSPWAEQTRIVGLRRGLPLSVQKVLTTGNL